MKKRAAVFVFIVSLITVLGVFFVTPGYFGKNVRPWRLGLDLIGGSHLVYDVDLSQVPVGDQAGVMSGLRDVIERRVNLFGVAEPQVVTAKSGDTNRLIVELAGISDVSDAILLIGETPVLEFYEEQEVPAPVAITDLGLEGADGADVPVETPQATMTEFVPTSLTGRYVKGAMVNFNQVNGRPEIAIEFDDTGAELFEEITGRNIGKPVAIVLDGEAISTPVVQQKIVGGNAQITGQFTLEEAKLLVERFNAGALPAPITLVSQQTIGATLGTDSLTKTLFAGTVGTLLVMIFMLLYYRRLGFFASIALVIYVVLLMALFKLFGITMTLAGIAGIILSIGMAVDANILIFERVREELRKGTAAAEAMREGFARAWPSIRDSNITTMITSVILYTFTSSFVKGFALSLLLGVIVSMFSAITVTRNLLFAFVNEKK